jgi:hypothetical protein
MIEKLVNPAFEHIHTLPVGTTFFVEGVLTRNEHGKRVELLYGSSRTVEFARIAITTNMGIVFEFEGSSFPLKYESGVLENVRDWVAEVGEAISIEATIIVDDTLVKRPSIGYNKARMLVPSPRRQAEYDALRATVTEKLDEFEFLAETAESPDDFIEIRKGFAQLRRHALTKSEQMQLRRLVRRLPVNERPIYDSWSTYARDAIEKAFGVNLEQLNAEEYLVFARKVLFGEIENPAKPDRVDQSYLFRLLDEPPFTSAQSVELVFSTLKVRVKRLEQVGDTHDEYWDDFWLVEQCLTYLGTIKDSSTVEALAWMIDYCLEHRYFDSRLSRREKYIGSHKFDSMLDKAIDSLARGAQYHELRAPAGFDFGRMKAWNDTLAAYPFMDHTADKLRKSFFRLFAA